MKAFLHKMEAKFLELSLESTNWKSQQLASVIYDDWYHVRMKRLKKASILFGDNWTQSNSDKAAAKAAAENSDSSVTTITTTQS